MEKAEPIISLCLPTNGVIEWVFPVLDSIYSQNVDTSLFEVIVTDNGNNDEFVRMMIDYEKKHENLTYKKTTAYMFHNQLEALKIANGKFFKFVNHRAVFTDNSLQKMIDIIIDNIVEKPVIYFSCGAMNKEHYELDSFDSFIRTLKRSISWTTGVGIWKEDYKRIPSDVKIDKISPHSCILFSERKKNKYIIENYIFSKELPVGHAKKGAYDLFKAFAVEEVTIALNLFMDGDISAETFKCVRNDYKKFCSELYFQFCIKKNACSYDLSGFDSSMGIFFNKSEIIFGAYALCMRKVFRKILGLFKRG